MFLITKTHFMLLAGVLLSLLTAPVFARDKDNMDTFTDVIAHDAWIREAPPSIRVLAGYLKLENKTGYDIRLLRANSPDFMHVEIHQMAIEGGVARMTELRELMIPPYQTISLLPGGLHLMMMGSKKALKQGDKVKVTLYFSHGAPLFLDMEVKKSF
ncbi:copper chaperone PCu(A)C [Candidatus Venteria ishoeyi]|uniref:copper chaperone PCu(A)C n=1 Tax=Candidatus Venteria ishoeyi TaxID=1899563 RepID=UPI0025A65AA4|nr:copper chaperone PCu(A)C [Candidatus Venteria ishoeyi]MDM8545007.1 copper chaperone PCu(A)C [Candidatus Venteria ishoeyi]